ncbi:MerR family transcriptional regulator [Levilactobacillus zymae]|uniref:MerR family transcriptional regulator n=1 Tax=Levilactobacillus zymae TaxID=267363 RepID=UPI001E2EC249|nr:MerR family transcriptional regulator [Levilactobacillus zymae]
MAITKMTKDALRYYERLGILGTVPRNHNHYRQYSRQNLERLQFVQIFKQLGLDLNLLAGTNLNVTPVHKANDLRHYQQAVHQEQRRLADIDTFLQRKIDYFDDLATK